MDDRLVFELKNGRTMAVVRNGDTFSNFTQESILGLGFNGLGFNVEAKPLAAFIDSTVAAVAPGSHPTNPPPPNQGRTP